MPAFQYVALTSRGKTRKGVLEGDSPRQVRQQLREYELVPISVAQVNVQNTSAQQKLPSYGNRLKAVELALITRQLATLVGSGQPLEQSFATVAKQVEKARLEAMLLALRTRILEGHSMATALGDYPRAFPELYRATVAAGEQSGHLEVVLERLADYTEQRQQLKQKVGLALIYPLLLTVVAVVIVTALLSYVVPQVVQVFVSTGQQLPLLTRLLIDLSSFLQHYGWYLLLGIILLSTVFYFAWQKPVSRYGIQKIALRVPLLGRLLRGSNSARFTRTLSILSASGVPLLEGLRIAAQVIANLPMRAAVAQAANQVKEGGNLHTALARSGYFPPLTVQLIASGESSGRLEAMLERAAIQQEQETETLIATILGLFEPLLILIMGAIVLIIVLAILLPIFDLNQLVR